MRSRRSLLAIAVLSAAAGLSCIAPAPRRYDIPKSTPDNRGRRWEDDAAAIEKAEAKRARKAAKRIKP